jgi:hypothetical protein
MVSAMLVRLGKSPVGPTVFVPESGSAERGRTSAGRRVKRYFTLI